MPATLPPPAPTRSAQELLRGSSRPELRRLTAVESADEITLIGQVPTFYHKQLAQELVRPAAAGRRISNRVQVADQDFASRSF